jgi:protein TonB
LFFTYETKGYQSGTIIDLFVYIGHILREITRDGDVIIVVEMISFFRNKKDFDDLIFENRNKAYGAYNIRRGYDFTVMISVVIASAIVTLFVLYPYIQFLGRRNDITQQMTRRYVEVKMDRLEPPEEKMIIPPAIDPPPANATPNVRYVAPVVVDTVLAAEKPPPTVAEVQASNPSTTELVVTGTGTSSELLSGEEGLTSDEPFMIVEVPPSFKGGDLEKFREWVQKRANYPQMAQDNGIQGKVYLTFVVERDGSVSNVNVVRSVDPLLDEEAKKAIMSSPKWAPGLQRGRAVRVRFYIPLVFTLNK